MRAVRLVASVAGGNYPQTISSEMVLESCRTAVSSVNSGLSAQASPHSRAIVGAEILFRAALR